MNTKSLNSLADLICRAQEQDRTPMGIAFAVDAAGRHMTPEVAAELARLRSRVSELEAERHGTNEALSDAAEALRVGRDRMAELEAERTRPAPMFDPVAGLERLRQEIAAAPVEDPHDSPLHHAYTTGRDLPEVSRG
ncbi:hypothetical protein ACIOD1_12720 [Streptomyces sp. NPDC088097]|uniref:hypothetical protein n=1 Tax=Streptomyces sp. NPDC088097 TaxID=3365823 RepID=UPI003823344B